MSISLAGVKILGSALIFIFGCLGACAPVAAHHGSKKSVKLSHYLGFVQQLMLSLGAGVVLATAFVHILPEGVESLANGGLGKDEHDHDHEHDHHHDDNHTHDHDDDHTHTHDHDHDNYSRVLRFDVRPTTAVTIKSVAQSKLSKLMRGLGGKTRKDVTASSSTTTAVTTDLLDDATLAAILASVHSSEGKKLDAEGLRHLIMAAKEEKASSALSAPLGDNNNEDVPYLTHNAEDEPYPWAYLFVLIGIALTFVVESELHRLAGKTKGDTMKVHLVEAGIAMHSILVGIAFGALNDINTGKTLMIALFFHQMCEGFAIGPLIHKGSNSLLHSIVLIVIFGGATPVGVAIGAIVDAYSDPNSKEAQLTQGIMMLIACGLLVHVGCVEFLAGLMHDIEHQALEIEHEHEHKVHRRKERQIVEAAAKALHIEGAIVSSDEGAACSAAGGLATRSSFVETWGGPTTRGSNGINNGNSVNERSGLIDHVEKNVGEEEAEEAEEARQIEEMKNDFLSQNPKITRIATYVFFYIGAALMSLIALWV